MKIKNRITKVEDEDPFKDMGFIKFWAVSSLFWMTFPASLFMCYIILGVPKTKQLVTALLHDFLQTIFIILIVLGLAIYGIYYYASSFF